MSADRAPSLRVIPWHLPYNWGKSTEKPQSGWTENAMSCHLLTGCSNQSTCRMTLILMMSSRPARIMEVLII